MGLIFRRTKRVGDTDVNVTGRGVSLSRRVGDRLRLNSRGTGSFRVMRGLSFRFGRRR
jgi:hypothetical protein